MELDGHQTWVHMMNWPGFPSENEAEFEKLPAGATAVQIVEAAIRTKDGWNAMGAANAFVGYLVGPLEKRLSKVEPFSTWNGFAIYHDESRQGIDAAAGWAQWIVQKIAAGWSAERIVERAEQWIASNSAMFHDVFVLSGIEVTEIHQIDSGIYLCPPNALIDLWNTKKLFGQAQGPVQDPGIRSAIVLQYEVAPIAGPRAVLSDTEIEEFRTATSIPVPPYLLRQFLAHDVRNALVLASDCAIEIVGHYTSPADDDYPSPIAPAMARFDYPRLPAHAGRLDTNRVPELLRLLRAFKPARPMRLAIDRFANARHEHGANAAIDLGIALDILLRHNDEDRRDVGEKVRRRAEHLCGPSAGGSASDLYAARSEAVHQGDLSFPSPFNPIVAQSTVMEVIMALLNAAELPDWNAIFPQSNQQLSPLERLQRAWRAASHEERTQFRTKIAD